MTRVLFAGPTRSATTYLWNIFLDSGCHTIHKGKEHYLFESKYGESSFYSEYLSEFGVNSGIVDFSPTVFHLYGVRNKILNDDFFDKIIFIVRDPLELWTSSYRYGYRKHIDVAHNFNTKARALAENYSYSWLLEAVESNPSLVERLVFLDFNKLTKGGGYASFFQKEFGVEWDIDYGGKFDRNSSDNVIQNDFLKKLASLLPLWLKKNLIYRRLRAIVLLFFGKRVEVNVLLDKSSLNRLDMERKIVAKILNDYGI